MVLEMALNFRRSLVAGVFVAASLPLSSRERKAHRFTPSSVIFLFLQQLCKPV